MSDYENAIAVSGLTKKYDGFTLDNVSFVVPKGSIMGFIGRNGAGKTTTIKALLNIFTPDGGTIEMLGMDNRAHEYEIKQHIAAVFDEIPFHENFTADMLSVMFRGLYSTWDEKTYISYLERFGLPRRKKLGKFSKGMKMKLQIAAALSHGAKLLIMDEATTGLDPVVRNEVLDIFREYLRDDENSILMSSHITSDLEKIADCVTFIDKGKILLTGYKDDIIDSHGVIRCTKDELAELSREDYISARVNDFGAEAMVSDRADAKRRFPGMIVEKTTLEEIMLFYVNREKKVWS